MNAKRDSAKLTFVVVWLLLLANGATATDGYFQHGFGARQKALGGAGVADGKDATTTSLNPAGLVHSGNEVSAAVSWFSPIRSFEGGGAPGFTPTGEVESLQEDFFIPNLAASYRLAPGSIVDVVGLTVYGNGGMNTNYGDHFTNGVGFPGVYGGGKAGVDLQQALISFGAAKQFGSLSVGVAPTILRQRFKARGLQAFGLSPNPDNDVAWGIGLRGGVEWAAAPWLRFGVAGSSRIYSQKFEGYERLFAEGGDFDIPPSLQAGVAVDLNSRLTLLVDYKRIWYSEVNSVANPSTNIFTGAQFGDSDGPGFGWDDVDVIKAGLEWQASDALTLRAGYSYVTSALNSRDVLFNILAPAVVQHHITAGFEYQLNPQWSIELAGLYAPESKLSGGELALGGPFNPDHSIELSMHQYDVTVGIKYRFDEPGPSLK